MDQKSPLKQKHLHPADLEKDIHKTQESLEENLKHLENMVQQKVSDSFDEISDRIQSTTEHIKSVAMRIKTPMKKALDIPSHVNRSPYISVCSAFAAGALIAAKSTSMGSVRSKNTSSNSNATATLVKDVAMHTTKTFLNVQIEKYLRASMEAKSGGSDGT